MASLGLAVVLIGLTVRPAAGRLVKRWSVEDLNRAADLVVVASPVASADTRDTFDDHGWPLEEVGVDTTFAVRRTLKGEAAGDRLIVLHCRFGARKPGGAEAIYNGPDFVSFRTQPAAVRRSHLTKDLPGEEYLLFLRQRKDGRYEFVSGQLDPGLSIREAPPATGK
jgi:hypothetical protein